MLLNMSLTAPTLLEATPAEDGWPAPPPPPPPATALLPLGEVESLGLSLTWIDKKPLRYRQKARFSGNSSNLNIQYQPQFCQIFLVLTWYFDP